jgi:hypothetical protein
VCTRKDEPLLLLLGWICSALMMTLSLLQFLRAHLLQTQTLSTRQYLERDLRRRRPLPPPCSMHLLDRPPLLPPRSMPLVDQPPLRHLHLLPLTHSDLRRRLPQRTSTRLVLRLRHQLQHLTLLVHLPRLQLQQQNHLIRLETVHLLKQGLNRVALMHLVRLLFQLPIKDSEASLPNSQTILQAFLLRRLLQ